jgi:hypothetical protein
MTPKRIPKSKDQVKAEMLLKQDVAQEKKLAQMIFPYLQKMDTVYDAQTLLHGISGYIHHQLENKMNEFKVNDLPVDVSQEKEGVFRDMFEQLLILLKDEKADHTIKFMKRYGDMLGYYASKEYLKNPMSIIKEEDLIKEPKIR